MRSKRLLLLMVVLVSMLAVLSIGGILRAQEATESPDEYGGMTMEQSPITPENARLIADVRQATTKFQDISTVKEAGYGKFLDCFVNKEVGGMGQHFVNGDLAGDDKVDPMKPEALVYEPTEDGKMNLVAFEYFIFADKWDPKNTGREAPELFGQKFHLVTTIPNTPPLWALHLWLWTSNPGGVFMDFNPLVFCPAGQPITDMTPKSS